MDIQLRGGRMRFLRWLFPFHNPAFRWGFTHPFGPPAPWWSRDRCDRWYEENGVPWKH